MRIIPQALGAASLAVATAAHGATSDTPFLDFPYVDSVSAAKVPAVAWLARQADRSMVLFARAPDFRRITLAARNDEQGQPITDVTLAPDGRHVVFTTGQPRGEMTFNPASLVDAPAATLWLQSTAAPCCSSTPATSWRSALLRPPSSRSSSPRAVAAGRSSSGPRPATSSSSTTAAAIPSSAVFT